MPSRADHFDHESCIASISSFMNRVRHVHAGHDHAGDVALLDLVVDPGERDRELVVGEADVREVRVDPAQVLRVDVDVELTLLASSPSTPRPRILLAWTTPYTLRRFKLAVTAFVAVARHRRGRLRARAARGSCSTSVYRSIVTLSLTGLDTSRRPTAGEVSRSCSLLAGVAIFRLPCERDRRADRARRADGSGGRAKEAEDDREPGRPLHHLRLRPGRPRVARGVPCGRRAVRRPRFQPGRRSRSRAGRAWPGSRAAGPNDDDLARAGLARAQGLVASSDSDVDNLYITLSARAARPDLPIVARASTEDAALKMLRAGADRVVQPYAAAGQEMANLMLKPQVSAFLDIVSPARRPRPPLRGDRGHGRVSRRPARRSATRAFATRPARSSSRCRSADGSFDTTPTPDVELGPATC